MGLDSMSMNAAWQNTKPLKIISASRRTDMPASDPQNLADRLEEKAPPRLTHTVVLWTKNPYNLLHHQALRKQLVKYEQLFVLLSITGLGGSCLEPRVPAPEDITAMLPALIRFVGSPQRIAVRFDPIVHFQMPDESSICNLEYFAALAPEIASHGITRVITSWVQIYGKVARRLNRMGIKVVEISDKKQHSEMEWLHALAGRYNITVNGCCVPGWPRSRCIDGPYLNQLHPQSKTASTERARGQRALCGCTESLDIGWYHSCIHGCIYCYGNPQIVDEN